MKSIISLLIQALFYSLFIVILFFLIGEKVDFRIVINSIFPVSSGLWWFLSSYITLMILSPILNASFEHISQMQMKIVIGGLIVLNNFSSFIFNNNYIGEDGYSIFNFITIYLVARYISYYNLQIKRAFWIYLFSVVLVFLINVGVFIVGKEPVFPAFRYSNPFLLIATICLFSIFKGFRFNNLLINKLAPLSFGVYLIHNNPLIWAKLQNLIVRLTNLYFDDTLFLLMVLFILALFIFIICLGIEKGRSVICKPLVNIIDQKVSKIKFNTNKL